MSRKNYTEREKSELLTIVQRFKQVIENKCTNAVTVAKKNEAWDAIALEFNASSEYPRTAKQLCTAYQNLKRHTRKRVADENVQLYIQNKSESTDDINKDKTEFKKFKRDEAEDKKAIKATGGGKYTPILSDVGAQMLALMGEQIKPLSNSCDSATSYFNSGEIQDVDETLENEDNILDIPKNNPEEIEIVETPEQQNTNKTPASNSKQLKKHKHVQLRGKKTAENTNTIKRKFYKKKLECAILEKRTAIANYNLVLKKQKLLDLEIKIKQLEYTSKLP